MKQTITTIFGIIIIIIAALAILFVLLQTEVITVDKFNDWLNNSWISEQYETLELKVKEIQ
jgi:uncharacterized protein YxeA